MDFFSWQNMHNVRFSAAIKPVKGLTVTADYHLFWLADTADYFYSVSGLPRTDRRLRHPFPERQFRRDRTRSGRHL